MEVEAVTHALCWITSKDDSRITHAVILTDSMSLLRKLEWETKTLPVSTKPRTLHHQSTGRERHGHHTIGQLEERGVDIMPSMKWRREAWTSDSSVNWRREAWTSHHQSTGGERCGHHTIGQMEVRAVDITPSMKWRRGAQTSHHRLTRGERHGHHTIDEVEERGVAITPLIDWRREEWTLHHWSTGGERCGHHTIGQLEKRGMERGSA